MKKIEKNNNDTYWNHNTAYHNWVLSNVKGRDSILDVGCGEGLLIYKLSKVCKNIIGIDTHEPSIEKAKKRIKNINNVSIIKTGFEEYNEKDNTYEAIIFVASIHHMNFNLSIKKSAKLLKPGGVLLIVGLARPKRFIDYFIEYARFIPCKIGDMFHEVKGDVGAPIKDAEETMEDIINITKKELPNSKIKYALYYRYLLKWIKPNKDSNEKEEKL